MLLIVSISPIFRRPDHQVIVFWPQQARAQKKSLKATLQWLCLAKPVNGVRHLCWKLGSLLRQPASHLIPLGLNSLSSTMSQIKTPKDYKLDFYYLTNWKKLSFTVFWLSATDHKKSYKKPATQNLRNENCVHSTHEIDPRKNCLHEL